MAYRDDNDLAILATAEDDDLKILMDYLIRDKEGDPRLTEELTLTAGYKANPDHPHTYWKDIAGELQCFGANTVVTILRGGKGVMYREILCDVCDKLKVNYNGKASVSMIEMNLLQTILLKAIDEMDFSQMKEVIDSLELKTNDLTKQAVLGAVQAAVLRGGFMSYQIAVIVANAVAKALLGRGLTLAGNAALTRAVGIFAGPIGWAVTALWTIIDATGPAYRVTIPSVIQVAYIRAKSNQCPL